MTTVANLSYLRKFLIKFSSTLIGILTVFSIIALFSIWSLNRAYHHSQEDAQKIRDLADEALISEINFKIQVQEWKNILLRGTDHSLRMYYYEAFTTRVLEVERHLNALVIKTQSIGLSDFQTDAQALLAEHKRVVAEYQSALKSFPVLTDQTARLIDKKLMGIDRDLELGLTAFGQKTLELNASRREHYNQFFSEHYETLRMMIIISIIISFLMTSLNVYGALRVMRE